MENKKSKRVYVVGHKNPDTDSICSAIAYANLKNQISNNEYTARRAGQINEETQFVLRHFGVEAPRLLANVHLQVKDMDIKRIEGIKSSTSIKEAWAMMKEENVHTLPVARDHKLEKDPAGGLKAYLEEIKQAIIKERGKINAGVKTD